MLDTFSSNVHNSSFSAKLLIDIVKAEHDEEQSESRAYVVASHGRLLW